MKTLVFLFFLGVARLQAVDITAIGGWSTTLSATDLSAGAGTNVPSSLTSPSAATTLALANNNVLLGFYVYAHISATTWPPGSTLWIKRTADGTNILGLGSITGGTSYIALTTVDQLIFSGYLDRSGITCQYKVDGLAVTVPANTYSANVVFTVIQQ